MNEFVSKPFVVRGIPLDSQTQVGCFGEMSQVLRQQGYNLGVGLPDRPQNNPLPCKLKTDHLSQGSCKKEISTLIEVASQDE